MRPDSASLATRSERRQAKWMREGKKDENIDAQNAARLSDKGPPNISLE